MSSREIWDSEAAVEFEDVVEDLPEKLELVAVRYERCAEALDGYHPTLARTKDEAEHWIVQAERAQAEIERCEAGVARMEDFEDQAERIANDLNAERDEGDPPHEPEQWAGEDYRASLASAQADFDAAVARVQSAEAELQDVASTTTQRIRDAGDDDLTNDSGILASIRRAARWVVDNTPLAEIVAVLDKIAAVLGVVALVLQFIPVFGTLIGAAVGAVAVIVGVAALIGHAVMWAAGEQSGWGVALAALGVVGGGLARIVRGAIAKAGGNVFGKLLGKKWTLSQQVFRNPRHFVRNDSNPTQFLKNIGGRPEGWSTGTLGRGSHTGTGWKMTDPGGRTIRYHPGGGRHGKERYWTFSSGEYRTHKVVDLRNYKPTPGEGATLHSSFSLPLAPR